MEIDEIYRIPVPGWALLLNHKEYLPVDMAATDGDKGYWVWIKDGRDLLLPDSAYVGPDARLNGVFEIDETKSPCDELQRLFYFVHDTPVILGKAFSTAKPFNCDPLQIAEGTNLILYGPTVAYKAFDLYFFKAEADGLHKVFFRDLYWKLRDGCSGPAAEKYAANMQQKIWENTHPLCRHRIIIDCGIGN